MPNLHFYNYNHRTFNPSNNLFTQTIDLTNCPKDIEIIFPYILPKAFRDKKQTVLSRKQILKTQQDKQNLQSQQTQSNHTTNPINSDYQVNINAQTNTNSQINTNDTYRIIFSPRQITNNKFSFEYSDLVCRGVDLALGQEEQARLPYSNYYRLPMWCVELFGLLPSIKDIANKIEQLEALRKQNPFLREKFLGLVAKRDRKHYLHGVKGLVLDLIADDYHLSQLVTESGGRFRNNTNDLTDKYHNSKVDYLKQFTFNLCPESMNYFSVVTEKLAHCLEAGCIPIYWGDLSQDAKYFNVGSMIQFDPSKPMELPLKIHEVLFYQNEFLEQNVFNEHAAQLIFEEIYLPIFMKIEQDLNIPIYSLKSNLA